MNPFEGLEPAAVWSHFAALCAIPRPSGREEAVREHVRNWALARGMDAAVDAAGNLILRKPGSPGSQGLPGVVLQGHLDMVCQANSGTNHDFTRDPIRPDRHDGWLQASQTTLGADNGIGVALALAVLEDGSLVHPPLEVLLTVSEETGMDGARSLAPGLLRGRVLLNLDTEEWGHFYLGCAGGMDVRARRDVSSAPVPGDFRCWRIGLAGLSGGHSGIDIHLGRGNAIRLLAEVLLRAASTLDLRLLSLEGGTARNAIPREAFARVAVPEADGTSLVALLRDASGELRGRLAATDPAVEIATQKQDLADARALVTSERDLLLQFLVDAPNGVAAMSADFPGVVETSSNLGVVRCNADDWSATFMVRSLRDEGSRALADTILALAANRGVDAKASGAYPGWAPDPASRLLARCRRVYEREFGAEPGLRIIHAGLECGLFASSHPGLEMISFGPDIRGAHAPGERVEIASVARCWRLLCAILADLGRA